MPYPEICPSCSGPFRNTGSHFTARRLEGPQRVLLELGCQNTAQRFWWDFTSGQLRDGERDQHEAPLAAVAAAGGGVVRTPDKPGHGLAVLGRSRRESVNELVELDDAPREGPASDWATDSPAREQQRGQPSEVSRPQEGQALRAAFVRQLQVDRITLRHVHTWLDAPEADKVGLVAQSATDATYERLALVLFGCSLADLLAESSIGNALEDSSAEEKLARQREKARLRARQRRALLRAVQTTEGDKAPPEPRR